MFTNIAEVIDEWNQEAASTQKVFDALTDSSLQQPVTPDGRTLGRIAWHIVTSTPEFLTHFGVNTGIIPNSGNVPTSAKEISMSFRKISIEVAEKIKQQLTDQSLTQLQNSFGKEMTNAAILLLLIKHIIHHRGQMTVLMRQAGLIIPGVYGPASEEWHKFGMEVSPV